MLIHNSFCLPGRFTFFFKQARGEGRSGHSYHYYPANSFSPLALLLLSLGLKVFLLHSISNHIFLSLHKNRTGLASQPVSQASLSFQSGHASHARSDTRHGSQAVSAFQTDRSSSSSSFPFARSSSLIGRLPGSLGRHFFFCFSSNLYCCMIQARVIFFLDYFCPPSDKKLGLPCS